MLVWPDSVANKTWKIGPFTERMAALQFFQTQRFVSWDPYAHSDWDSGLFSKYAASGQHVYGINVNSSKSGGVRWGFAMTDQSYMHHPEHCGFAGVGIGGGGGSSTAQKGAGDITHSRKLSYRALLFGRRHAGSGGTIGLQRWRGTGGNASVVSLAACQGACDAAAPPFYTLVRRGWRCKSPDSGFGAKMTLGQCADACKHYPTCTHFRHEQPTGWSTSTANNCWMEMFRSTVCDHGWSSAGSVGTKSATYVLQMADTGDSRNATRCAGQVQFGPECRGELCACRFVSHRNSGCAATAAAPKGTNASVHTKGTRFVRLSFNTLIYRETHVNELEVYERGAAVSAVKYRTLTLSANLARAAQTCTSVGGKTTCTSVGGKTMKQTGLATKYGKVGNVIDGKIADWQVGAYWHTYPGSGFVVDLGKSVDVGQVMAWQRSCCCPEKLQNFKITLLADDGAGYIGAAQGERDYHGMPHTTSVGSVDFSTPHHVVALRDNLPEPIFVQRLADTAWIDSVSPSSGFPGTTVIIRGQGFTGKSSDWSVALGDAPCAATRVYNATTIGCTVPGPHAAGSAPLFVSSANLGAAGPEAPLTFTYQLAVDGISPARGSIFGGQRIRITGRGFPLYSAGAGGASVRVGGEACTMVASNASSLECVTPVISAYHATNANGSRLVSRDLVSSATVDLELTVVATSSLYDPTAVLLREHALLTRHVPCTGGDWARRIQARSCRTGVYDPKIATAIAARGFVDCNSKCLYEVKFDAPPKSALVPIALTGEAALLAAAARSRVARFAFAGNLRETAANSGDEPLPHADLACPPSKGYCLDSDARDQNSGVARAPGNYASAASCLAWCRTRAGSTGCEYIDRGASTDGCYAHTAQVSHGSGSSGYTCFVFDRCTRTAAAAAWTGASTNSMSLVNKGGSGCTSSKKCTRCQGDCDRDSDCSEGLLCWQRNGKEHVPGCMIGGGGDVNNYDFCYAPMNGRLPKAVYASSYAKEYSWGSSTTGLLLGDSTRLGITGGAFTLSAWVYIANAGTISVASSGVDAAGNLVNLAIANYRPTMSFGTFRSACANSSNYAPRVAANTWTHVAWVYEAGHQTMRTYVSGKEHAECIGRLSYRGKGGFTLGGTPPSGSSRFQGKMRGVELHNASLGAATLAAAVGSHGRRIWRWNTAWCWDDSSAVNTYHASCVGDSAFNVIKAMATSRSGLNQSFTYDRRLTPLVHTLSRLNGTTAGGTTVTITGQGFGTGGVDVLLDGVACATSRKQVGQYRSRNLCAWGEIQRARGQDMVAVDCSNLGSNDTHITCLTNPLPPRLGPPSAAVVDVIVPGKGRAELLPKASSHGAVAKREHLAWTYTNLWSAKTTWGGNDLPRSGDSIVVTSGEYIMLDMSPPRPVTALLPQPPTPPSLPVRVLARACLWCFGRSNSGVNLPSCVKSTPDPCLTPRISAPAFAAACTW